MGLQQSKPQKTSQKPIPSSSSSYYGGILTHNPNTNTIYQQFIIEQKMYQNFTKLIQFRQKLSHQNFITVKNYWKKSQKSIKLSCTTDKKIQVFVQYQSLTQSLSKKLDKLSENSKIMPQSQLKRICLCVLSCLIYLQSKNTCHGDIKPQSIFFDSLGQIKILDSFFMNGGRTSFQIVMQNPSSMSLLSPEQLQRIRDRQCDDISLVYKNQIFSLGLTLYQCMTFQPAMACYDLQKLKIKKNHFKGKQEIMLANGYSKKFVEIVMGLILKPAEQRMDFIQFYEILKRGNY